MVLSSKMDPHHHGGDDDEKRGGASAAAMNKIKAMRTLRLLRLLRLLRFLKSIGWINTAVDMFLNALQWAFIIAVIVACMVFLILEVCIALRIGEQAWLREHALPKMPKID